MRIPSRSSLRLRSLTLTEYDHKFDYFPWMGFSWQAMMDSLPHLTSLHCNNISDLGIPELLAIASHSTLEQLHISIDDDRVTLLNDYHWIGGRMQFPISAEEDQKWLAENILRCSVGDAELAEESEADHVAIVEQLASKTYRLPNDNKVAEKQQRLLEADIERMRAALSRTRPSRRSCEVRLALADWLRRRLRQGKLFTDDHVHSLLVQSLSFAATVCSWRCFARRCDNS